LFGHFVEEVFGPFEGAFRSYGDHYRLLSKVEFYYHFDSLRALIQSGTKTQWFLNC